MVTPKNVNKDIYFLSTLHKNLARNPKFDIEKIVEVEKNPLTSDAEFHFSLTMGKETFWKKNFKICNKTE